MFCGWIFSRKAFFASVLIVAVLKGSGTAQMDSAKIFGFAVDESGNYVGNVDIELIDLDRGLHRRVALEAT